MANIERLKQDIETLTKISEPCDGGVTRIGLTATYRQGIEYVKQQMQEIGLTIQEDDVGNLYGICVGSDKSAPSIISGSHLDTVKNAGAFDGIAGVVCALEVARMLKEQNIQLKHTFEVLGTVEEEGTHFGRVLLGSRFMTGEFGDSDRDRLTNDDNQSLRSVLADYSRNIVTIPAKRKAGTIKAFVEVHDEQGPVLEATQTDIGIVENIVAIAQMAVTLTGFAGHAGTVPMTLRQDAGIAGCQLVSRMNEYVLRKYADSATLTVGKFSLQPNSANCVPNQSHFTIDIRSGKPEIVKDIMAYIQQAAVLIENEYSVTSQVVQVSFKDPIMMDPSLQHIITEACEELNLSYRQINSGAGHDAMVLANICPTAMIFIPCHKGITHHPDEHVSWQDMAKGTDLLFETIIRIDRATK